MLVNAATVRAVGKQQQRSANEKTSRGHKSSFLLNSISSNAAKI